MLDLEGERLSDLWIWNVDNFHLCGEVSREISELGRAIDNAKPWRALREDATRVLVAIAR
jgi:hypothetical protein